ncbi:MAG: D-alanyl-D-alanine carboxypeptidase family protein [Acidimicrobiales bacterium]
MAVAGLAVTAVVRAGTPGPDGRLTLDVSARVTVGGTRPVLPWPATGQAAVAVPALGFAAQSGPEQPVPIASLTKLTTAVVVLRDHPMPVGGPGPTITMTPADVAAYDRDLAGDQSTVPVSVGERLTEWQLLEALLTQSANNVAYALAVWDAGTQAAFVAKMNALASSLSMTGSHFVDASGVARGSVSTAADTLKVAAAGMAIPAFRAVVAMPVVTLPLLGRAANLVPEVGTRVDGVPVVGVKSGFTAEAGGCLVLAARVAVGERTVTVLAAVLGQPYPAGVPFPALTPSGSSSPTTAGTGTGTSTGTGTTGGGSSTSPTAPLYIPDPLRDTRPVTDRLLAGAVKAVVPDTVLAGGLRVGTVRATWGGVSHAVAVVVSLPAQVAGWPGQVVDVTVEHERSIVRGRRGQTVGTATVRLGSETATTPLRLAATVPRPGWWWRALHG